VGWEDTAVDPYQLGDYLREFQALVDRYDYSTSLYGHFGDGCIHARITFDTRTEEGVGKWRRFSEEIAKLVVRFGGSLSGEHGDGQAKAEFLPIMFGDELMQAFRRFKHAWDPERRMNPGKLIDAYKMDENLRFGPDYQTPKVACRRPCRFWPIHRALYWHGKMSRTLRQHVPKLSGYRQGNLFNSRTCAPAA
jgi:hypothetical protein